MSIQTSNGLWLVWLTFLSALLVQVMPLPREVVQFRPDILLMVVIYWSMALPHRFNVLTAFSLGLVLDIMLGAVLGTHALVFSLISYIVVINFQRLRNFPIWHQTMVVTLLICLYHLILFWVNFIIHSNLFELSLMYPIASVVLFWPWLFFMLRRVRRRYKVR